MKPTASIKLDSLHVHVYKHGRDDFSVWVTDDVNNESSGYNIRGKEEDMLVDFKAVFELLKQGFIKDHWESQHPLIDITPEEYSTLMELGFEDTSWHNDECASFIKGDYEKDHLRVWVDYPKQEDRAFPDAGRYTLEFVEETGVDSIITHLLTTDDLKELVYKIQEDESPNSDNQFRR